MIVIVGNMKSYLKKFFKTQKQEISTLSGCFLLIACGMHVAWTFSVYRTDLFHGGIDRTEQFFRGASLFIGTIFGAALAGVLVDVIGRKRTTIIGVICTLASGIAFVSDPEGVGAIIAGRNLIGVCLGVVYVTTILFSAEIMPKNLRGEYQVYLQLMIYLGCFYQYLIFSVVDSTCMNLVTGYSTLVIGFAASIALYFMTESPTFLIIRGMETDALKNLIYLHDKDLDPQITTEFNELKTQIYREYSNGTRAYQSLFHPDGNLTAFLVTLALKLTHVTTFNEPLFYFYFGVFSVVLADSSIWALTILIILRIGGGLTSLFLIDRLGRKPLLVISSIVFTMSMVVLISLTIFHQLDDWSLFWIPVVFIFMGEFAAALGYGSVPDVLAGECFATPGKSLAVATITVAEAFLSLLLLAAHFYSWFYTDVAWGIYCYTIASVTMFLTLGICRCALPETKKASLKEIQELWRQ